jgi:hypothetical protein
MSSLNNRNLLQMCSRFPDQDMALGNFAAGSPVMQRHTGKATRQIGALTEIDLAEFFGVSLVSWQTLGSMAASFSLL